MDDKESELQRLSRRGFLVKGVGAVALVAARPALAAHERLLSSDVAVGANVGAQLRKILALPSGRAAGKGLTIKLGGDYALSGPGAGYGVEQYHGALMGVAHVKAAGGPHFDFIVRDTPAGNVSQGGANTREFGNAGCPLVLTSQSGGMTGGVPFYPQYKMWAIDCGGALKANEGRPFLYQGRAEFTGGFIPAIVKYTKAKRPSAKRISYLGYDVLPSINSDAVSELRAAGFDVPDSVTVSIGAQDYSSAFSALQAQKPDIIIAEVSAGTDVGVMMKQYVTSGLNAVMIGVDYTQAAADVAGSSFAKYEFCFDYFNAANPTNAWAKLFTTEWRRTHKGALPNYYNANYYEAVFLMWDMVRRIIAGGGDPTKQGDLYVNVFNAKPAFSSVYGGVGAVHGTEQFSTQTHSLRHKQVAYGRAVPKGVPKILATADITGANFKLKA